MCVAGEEWVKGLEFWRQARMSMLRAKLWWLSSRFQNKWMDIPSVFGSKEVAFQVSKEMRSGCNKKKMIIQNDKVMVQSPLH